MLILQNESWKVKIVAVQWMITKIKFLTAKTLTYLSFGSNLNVAFM